MKPKKSLGQNFLNSPKFIGDIVRASGVTKEDVVLEIGPGKGALTEKLLEASKRVVAVEKDDDLIPLLEEKFSTEIADKRLTLMHGDVLTVDISPHVGETYTLVANIPYYITGLLLRYFLETKNQPKSMTVLVQKEVAERIVARDGKESILSMSVKAYGTPVYIEKVPARYFNPVPKVDSAILHIKDISRDRFKHISDEMYFEIMKTGFEHKRKMLLNNLESLYSKDVLREAFECCSVSENARAENITLDMWICLAQKLHTK